MGKEFISDYILEKYILNELSGEKYREVEEYLNNSPDAKKRLDMIKSSNANILDRYPAGEMAEAISRRYRMDETRNKGAEKITDISLKRIALPSFAIAAAAVVLIFIFPVIRPVDELFKNNLNMEITRVKGEKTGLYIYRKTANKIEIMEDRSSAKEGDLLQLAYFSAEDGYGVILSIDGRGTVTLHFPEGADSSTALNTGQKTVLPNSYELDDAPKFERFFFVTGRSELDVRRILSAAKALAVIPGIVPAEDLKIDKPVNQTSVLIEKGEQP